MKIFELLNPDQPTDMGAGSPTAPMTAGGAMPAGTNPTGGPGMAAANATGASMTGTSNPSQPPMQTAGLGSMISDFFTTPQPIGAAKGTPATPAPPTPGQPPAQSSGMISRPFGNTAVGQTLDKINGGLQGNPPKP